MTRMVIMLAMLIVASVYVERMRHLQFFKHPAALVVQHAIGGAVSIYSLFRVWEFGLDVLPVLAVTMAGVCLYTSRGVCNLVKRNDQVLDVFGIIFPSHRRRN